jgi:hypothetical protein
VKRVFKAILSIIVFFESFIDHCGKVFMRSGYKRGQPREKRLLVHLVGLRSLRPSCGVSVPHHVDEAALCGLVQNCCLAFDSEPALIESSLFSLSRQPDSVRCLPSLLEDEVAAPDILYLVSCIFLIFSETRQPIPSLDSLESASVILSHMCSAATPAFLRSLKTSYFDAVSWFLLNRMEFEPGCDEDISYELLSAIYCLLKNAAMCPVMVELEEIIGHIAFTLYDVYFTVQDSDFLCAILMHDIALFVEFHTVPTQDHHLSQFYGLLAEMPAELLDRAFPLIGAFWRRYPFRLTILLGGKQAELFHAGQLIPEHPKWGTCEHSLLETLIMSSLASEDPESVAQCFNLISEFGSPSTECPGDLMFRLLYWSLPFRTILTVTDPGITTDDVQVAFIHMCNVLMCGEVPGCNFVVAFHERGYLDRLNTLASEGVCSRTVAEEAMAILIRHLPQFAAHVLEALIKGGFIISFARHWQDVTDLAVSDAMTALSCVVHWIEAQETESKRNWTQILMNVELVMNLDDAMKLSCLVAERLEHYFGVDVREQWDAIEQRISELEGDTSS